MSTVEILRAAKAGIDTPEKWWRGTSATVANGLCAGLAVGEYFGEKTAASWRGAWGDAMRALARGMAIEGECMPGQIYAWNDSHTHAELMVAFDRAIANEEAREQEHNVTKLVELVA